MKQVIVLLFCFTTFLLTACGGSPHDYNEFTDVTFTTYSQAEQASNNRYILYYYDSTDAASDSIKQEVLSFFDTFELLEYYFVDTASTDTETSFFGAYMDEPIIYVVSNQEPYETYTGKQEIQTFISRYSSIEFEYDLFEDQHVDSIYDLLSIDNADYIVYYYLEHCPHCIATKPHFLPWAFSKSKEDIYFVNGASVEAPENFPNELIILNSGTPLLILMSNGHFADEYYSGKDDVVEYIEGVGAGDIVAENKELDYDYFTEHKLISYDNTLTITDELHFEYFYSPYCSHCNSVKSDMLTFFNELEDIPFYLINVATATGTQKINDFSGVPALYVVYQNNVIDSYIGSLQIPLFIEDYNNGNINYDEYK